MNKSADKIDAQSRQIEELKAVLAKAAQYCRECRDQDLLTPADFIIWGKFSRPEALGPRCYNHTAEHIGWVSMSQIDQWAVFDLRPFRAALSGEQPSHE
jgi:hypothetical protein